jgi:hypothetical protein
VISSSRFGASRDKVQLIKVEPLLVVEVSADAALQAGGYRHPLRFIRLRFDLTPQDLPHHPSDLGRRRDREQREHERSPLELPGMGVSMLRA